MPVEVMPLRASTARLPSEPVAVGEWTGSDASDDIGIAERERFRDQQCIKMVETVACGN